MKTELLQIRISPEFKTVIREAAEKENRTISNYIITVLQEKLKGETDRQEHKQ